MPQLRSIIAAMTCTALSCVAWAAERPVQLSTATGTLYGTLAVPDDSRAPFPAVLLIAGSGPTDRNGNQGLVKNDSLKLLSLALAANGIAALRYDKRGVGQSAAALTREEDLRVETYVADVVHWVEWLGKDPRFTRLALVGHSEGALIGTLAAKQTRVDAFVSIAGPGRTLGEVLKEQLAGKLPTDLALKNERIRDALAAGRTISDVPKELTAFYRPSVQPYLISWFKYDLAAELSTLEIPILILQGTTDLQVSVNDAKRLAAANKRATLRLITGMNHVLRHSASEAEQRAAYSDASLAIDAEAVKAITGFFAAELRR